MDDQLIGQNTFFPGFIVNGYLENELKRFEIISPAQTFSSFIPVMSSSIDDLYGEFLTNDSSLPIYIAYDRLSRFRPSPFYRHKREQMVYTIHGPLEKVYATARVIQAALDREDSAAQDVNLWSSKNQDKWFDLNLTPGSQGTFPNSVRFIDIDAETQAQETRRSTTQPIFFHNFKTFQMDESRDLLELAAVRGIYRNKIVVEYDYHTNDPIDALYT
jgi:hypothetical protein